MIITKTTPYSKPEIKKLQEQFGSYVKTVIDIEKGICSAGANRHFESEQILLREGANQKNIWGGGIDVGSGIIDYNSFINIRPSDNNPSNDILDPERRKKYDSLTRHFFKIIYEK